AMDASTMAEAIASAAARRSRREKARPSTDVAAAYVAGREALMTRSSLAPPVVFGGAVGCTVQPLIQVDLSTWDMDLETRADWRPIWASLKFGSRARACLNSAMARSISPSAM